MTDITSKVRELRPGGDINMIPYEDYQGFLSNNTFEDISDQLPFSRLYVGQCMRGLILFEGNKYYVSGWDMGDGIFIDIGRSRI